jgi:hypothetical protein
MLFTCPTCFRVHSSKPAAGDSRRTSFLCACGTTIQVPDEPHESRMHRLKDQIGERLACGLVGAAALGGLWFGFRDGKAWVGPSIGALVGLVLGLLLGERLLDWIR